MNKTVQSEADEATTKLDLRDLTSEQREGAKASPRLRLTKDVVERAPLPPPGRNEHFIRDTEVRGLGLRITAGGSKAFTFSGRIRGYPRRLTLGGWPDLTVAIARKMALDIRTRIARGEDPARDRERARTEPTFDAFTVTYLERHARPRKRSVEKDEQMLKRYVPSAWAARRLSDISAGEMARLHARVGAEHGHVAANRLMSVLRVMFRLAHDWELTTCDNPTARIKPFEERKRERYLSPEELQRVNAALLEEENPYWRAFFPLLLLTGARRSELLSMRWTDIDFNQRAWRIPTTKAGNSHLLPLPAPAMAILESLPSRDTSEWVFSGDGRTGHIVEPGFAWKRVRERASVADVRVHDLRHTFASWLVAQGYNLPLIGRALNHASTSTSERYAHLDLAPVRQALEQNAKLMTASQANETNVKPET